MPYRVGVKTRWLCKCDCGADYKVITYKLTQGKITSCLTCRLLPRQEAAARSCFHMYKYNAKQRGYEFLLSFEDFFYLLEQNCVYCGDPPKLRIVNDVTASLNGVDRYNNKLGYFASNCYACCGACNKMKSNSTFDEFQEKILKIHAKIFPTFME